MKEKLFENIGGNTFRLTKETTGQNPSEDAKKFAKEISDKLRTQYQHTGEYTVVSGMSESVRQMIIHKLTKEGWMLQAGTALGNTKDPNALKEADKGAILTSQQVDHIEKTLQTYGSSHITSAEIIGLIQLARYYFDGCPIQTPQKPPSTADKARWDKEARERGEPVPRTYWGKI